MNIAPPEDGIVTPSTIGQQIKGYAVHVYTASGVAFAFLAAAELCQSDPNARQVFLLLICAVLIDATDGPLARRWEVKRHAHRIDGRTIDDIVDYLTFTFIPLLLIWRMGWLPHPAATWVVPALIASLLGFANTSAKDEAGGYFLGFPSYWNIVAFYAGIWHRFFGPWPNALMLLGLTLLTVLPIRFIYPNLAPHPWRSTVIIGALAWLAVILAMLRDYPHASLWLALFSLTYPLFYTVLSVHLARSMKRHERISSR
jgi:phosphatidylcholine synthase